MKKEEQAACLHAPLFNGFALPELEQALACLAPRRQRAEKEETLVRAGDPVPGIGVLLSGSARVFREDYAGSREIVAALMPGDLFAEVFVFARLDVMPVSVEASESCAVLWFDGGRIARPCERACQFHGRLLENALGILAQKNLMQNRKLEHLSKRTTREKLLSYLGEQAQLAGSGTFTIPFNRQQLADYLCVERSAMSAELSRLREEGILETHRSAFKLLGFDSGWME